MKFINIASLLLLAGGADAMGNPLDCGLVEDCISITQTCESGQVRVCITSASKTSDDATCVSSYSHINIYADGLDLSMVESPEAPEECDAGGNHQCGEFTGTGVKWETSTEHPGDPDPTSNTYCAVVDQGVPLAFGFKKGNGCDASGSGMTCGSECGCNGQNSEIPACSYGATAITTCGTPPDDDPAGPGDDPEGPGDGSGMSGDPHIKSWQGEWFDYMGECDLKLMHVPMFDGKSDLDVHVRTTIEHTYSYVEAAALRIGNDILEVGGWGDFAFNGVDGGMRTDSMVPKLGGYPVYYTMANKKNHRFDVVVGENKNITLATFKQWVSVKVHHGDEELFGEASGLMGTYSGKMLARDGTDMHDDMDALGQDWQIQPEDGNLFRSVRAPQYPELCVLPSGKTAAATSRRLGQKVVDEQAAKLACSKFSGPAYNFCFHDVMASQDLELAQSGAF